MIDEMNDVRKFEGNIIDSIEYLFNVTTFCSADLNMKLSMQTPGRVYSKLRDFKFNFEYLFELSSKRKEIDDTVKNNTRQWLDMNVQYDREGVIESNYIKAGMKLFSMYGDELHSNDIITCKR